MQLTWLVLLAAVWPAEVQADVLLPNWQFVANSVRILNVQHYPDFVVLAYDADGSYTIVRPQESVTCDAAREPSGLAFYAIRKLGFREEELGSGDDAHTDYFENNDHLIRCKVFIKSHNATRGSPVVGLEQILRISVLNDTVFDIEHVKDVVSYGNGDVKEWSVGAQDLPSFRDFFVVHQQRCIRIQGMADHPECAFLMRYRYGYKMITANRDINFGQLYVVTSPEFSLDEIPEGRPEQWNYFVDNRKLTRLPLRLSVEPDLNRKPYTDKITNVFEIDTVTTGQISLRPLRVEYKHSDGTTEEKLASQVAYGSEPPPLDGIPDSLLSKPSREMAQYMHIQQLDSFPGFVFLRDWPRSDRVLGPLDTFPLESVYVVPKKEFHAEKLTTRDQWREFLRSGKAAGLYFKPGSLRALLSTDPHPVRVVYVFRLVRPRTGPPWCLPLRAICTYASGTTVIKEYPELAGSNLQPVPEAADSDATPVNRTVEREPRMPTRTGPAAALGWFSVIWFVLLPTVALAGIVLVLVLRRTRQAKA